MKRRRFLKVVAASAGGVFARGRRASAATPRVGVVGAGILGAAIAERLARRGVEVLVFERAEPATAATGRSFAWLNAHFSKTPHPYHLLNRLGVATWRELEAEMGRDALGLCWGGALEWAAAESAARELRDGTRQLQSWGHAVREVPSSEMATFAPRVVPGPVAAASFAEPDGGVDAARAARALLQRGRSAGAKIHTRCEVKSLDIRNDRLRAIDTTAGWFNLDRLVVAAGVSTPALAALAGSTVRLRSAPGLVIRTEPLPRLVEPVVIGPAVHLRQDRDGRIVVGEDPGPPRAPDHADLIGGRTDFPDAETADRHARRLLAAGAAFLPEIARARVEQVHLCLRPVPADGYPVVGPALACPDVYVAVTHSGVTLGPLLGRLVAQELLDGVATDLLAPYRPGR